MLAQPNEIPATSEERSAISERQPVGVTAHRLVLDTFGSNLGQEVLVPVHWTRSRSSSATEEAVSLGKIALDIDDSGEPGWSAFSDQRGNHTTQRVPDQNDSASRSDLLNHLRKPQGQLFDA